MKKEEGEKILLETENVVSGCVYYFFFLLDLTKSRE